MPTFRFQKADDIENTVDELIKRIAWLTSKLDSKNVKRLDTNETVIKSADGTTEIIGPILVQKDSNGTIRLKQGYDSGTDDFIYQLYNSSGDLTVDIDSNGDLVVEQGTFKASIEIGTGNNVVKADGTNGFWVGHADFASAPYKVTLAGAATMTNLTVIGGTITGATIRTAESGERIELSNNQIKTYDSSDRLHGFVTNNATGSNYGDGYYYDSGVKVLEFYNNLTGTGFSIRPVGTAALGLGTTGKTTQTFGTWDCTNASFTTLNDGISNYATQSFVTGQGYLTGTGIVGGSFTTTDGKTVTYNSDGLITNVV